MFWTVKDIVNTVQCSLTGSKKNNFLFLDDFETFIREWEVYTHPPTGPSAWACYMGPVPGPAIWALCLGLLYGPCAWAYYMGLFPPCGGLFPAPITKLKGLRKYLGRCYTAAGVTDVCAVYGVGNNNSTLKYTGEKRKKKTVSHRKIKFKKLVIFYSEDRNIDWVLSSGLQSQDLSRLKSLLSKKY